jgi:diacylglycerol kinase family enzyme
MSLNQGNPISDSNMDSAVITRAAGESGPESASKLRAVVNVSAGTALDMTQEQIRDFIEQGFAESGRQISVTFASPSELESAIEKAVADAVDILIVGGGDGTVRTAARHLIGTDTALGILPLGTFNRLAKDLEIPLQLEDAVRFLAAAAPVRIDVATVNDSIFLCNSVMGATLRFSEGRAELRGRPAVERLPKYVSLIKEVLSSRRKIAIVVDDGSQQVSVRALSVAVTNNGYDETTPWLRRSRLDGGKLSMYLSEHRSGWALMRALGLALLGLWRGDPDVTKLTASKFVIHSPRHRRTMAVDGEIKKLAMPLQFEIRPRCLSVLAEPRK